MGLERTEHIPSENDCNDMHILCTHQGWMIPSVANTADVMCFDVVAIVLTTSVLFNNNGQRKKYAPQYSINNVCTYVYVYSTRL